MCDAHMIVPACSLACVPFVVLMCFWSCLCTYVFCFCIVLMCLCFLLYLCVFGLACVLMCFFLTLFRKVSILRAHLSYDLRVGAGHTYQLGNPSVRNFDDESRQEFFNLVARNVPEDFAERFPELALHGIMQSALKVMPSDSSSNNFYRGYTQSDWFFCFRSLAKFFEKGVLFIPMSVDV